MKILTLYHGTNGRFDRFDQSKSRIFNDYWGGGVAYFTDNLGVAKTYATSMAKSKGGDKLVYEVRLKIQNLFDVDDKFTGKELLKFYTSKTSEEFARGAGLLRLGADKYEILHKLESGNLELTGSQVFHGLSQGMVYTAKARKKLESLGYDALRYNGGSNMNMATRHDVYLTYKATNISIIKRLMIDSGGEEYLAA